MGPTAVPCPSSHLGSYGESPGQGWGEQEFRDPRGCHGLQGGGSWGGGGLYSANGYILVSPVPLEQRLLQAGDRGHLPALPQRAAAVDPGGRLPQGVLLGL